MSAPLGRIEPKYSTDPAEANNHLVYCQKQARKQIKELMKVHGISQNIALIATRANYHQRMKNMPKVEKLKKEMDELVQKQQQMSVGESPFIIQTPDTKKDQKTEETIKKICAKVMNDFGTDLYKNPKFVTEANHLFLLGSAFATKDLTSLRKWIDDFSG